MSLFCKHILRTWRKSPVLPLLILLTVVLSVAVATCAVCTEQMFSERSENLKQKNEALGNVLITVRGDNEVRMLFCEDALPYLAPDDEFLGEYALNALCTLSDGNRRLLAASAVDLAAADAYCQFVYTEYGEFHTQNLEQSAILSDDAAEELGVTVGDPVTLRILNREMTYTVQAVAKAEGLLFERDVLIPVSGVVRLLSYDVPAIAVLGEHFTPYNRLMLRVSPDRQEAVIDTLSASPEFGDRQIQSPQSEGQLAYILFWQINAVRLLALLVLLLCGILIATCLHRLRVSRADEIALFCNIGASRRHLWGLQLLENALYALLGTLGGILLAIPLARLLGALFEWNTAPLRLSLGNILFGIGFAFLLMLGLSLPPLFSRKTEIVLEEMPSEETEAGKPQRLPRDTLPILAVLVLGSVLCFVVSPIYRLWPGLAAALALIRLYFSLSPLLLRSIAAFFGRLQSKRRPCPTAFFACRSLQNHPTAAHTARLLSVLLLLVFTLSAAKNAAVEQMDLVQTALRGDVIAMGMSEPLLQELQEHPAQDGLMRFRFSEEAELSGEVPTIVIAAAGDTDRCLHPDLLPQQQLRDNEAVISVGVGRLLNLSHGDEVTVTLQGVSQTYTVASLLPVSTTAVLLPPQTLTANDPVCIRFHADATEEQISDLFATLEENGILTLEPSDLLGLLTTVRGFLGLLDYTMFASVTVALVGIANLLLGQYRARTRERKLLALCGMTRARIATCYAAELVATLLLSLLLAAVGTTLLTVLIDRVLSATGMVLFV